MCGDAEQFAAVDGPYGPPHSSDVRQSSVDAEMDL